MRIHKALQEHVETPIPRHVMLALLREYQRPNDKISELIKSQELISIRRGLYVPGPESDLPMPEPFLIANHLRGPSYVSMESALAYWNMIPEQVYEVSSATTKRSTVFRTPVGRFRYHHLKTPYYAFGIQNIQDSPKQSILIASPEKALCDKIVLTPGVNLKSIKQTRAFLLEDLRMDADELQTLDTKLMELWLEDAPKQSSLDMLIHTLTSL